MATWAQRLNKEAEDWQKQAEDMKRQADAVLKLQSDVTSEEAKSPPIETKLKFINDLQAYNVQVPSLYDGLAKCTYNRVRYTVVQVSGSQMQLQAHTETLGDCARYLLNMQRASMFSSVTMAFPGLTAWQPGTPGSAQVFPNGINLAVNCTLKQPISAPAGASGVGGRGGSGAGGRGGAGAGGGGAQGPVLEKIK